MRMPPRQPRNRVGRSADRRGPSEAMNRSALSASRLRSQTLPRSGEPISSPISTMNLALKPSLPPRASRTARSAAMLMLCCPLLSAVPRPYRRVPETAAPRKALARNRGAPGIAAVAPLAFHAVDDVAMAVDQHGRRRLALVVFCEQERRLAAGRFDHPALEIERGESGHHLLFQIGAQLDAPVRILALGPVGDATVEFSEERAGFEIVTGAGDGIGSGHYFLF